MKVKLTFSSGVEKIVEADAFGVEPNGFMSFSKLAAVVDEKQTYDFVYSAQAHLVRSIERIDI